MQPILKTGTDSGFEGKEGHNLLLEWCLLRNQILRLVGFCTNQIGIRKRHPFGCLFLIPYYFLRGIITVLLSRHIGVLCQNVKDKLQRLKYSFYYGGLREIEWREHVLCYLRSCAQFTRGEVFPWEEMEHTTVGCLEEKKMTAPAKVCGHFQ